MSRQSTSAPVSAPNGHAPKSRLLSSTNPYLPALRAWDDVNGFAVRAMYVSYCFAGVFAVLALIGWGGMVYYANQPKLIPYVVQTDKLDQQLAVIRAERLNGITTDPAVVRAALQQFVFNVRSVTFDPVFQKNMIGEVRNYLASGSQAESAVGAFYTTNDPFKIAQKNSVLVTVDSPVPMSPTTYQVEWTEQSRSVKGEVLGLEHWRGFITITIHPAGDEATLMGNPAGVYVTDIQLSQVQGP